MDNVLQIFEKCITGTYWGYLQLPPIEVTWTLKYATWTQYKSVLNKSWIYGVESIDVINSLYRYSL